MELPENNEHLQMIKTEHNIKERLNLHVKRRLQQEPHILSTPSPPVQVSVDTGRRTKTTNDVNSDAIRRKEKQKTRKPYQKRTDKVKTGTSATAMTAATTTLVEGVTGTGSGRQYKRHKTKVVTPVALALVETGCGALSDESMAASVVGGMTLATGNGGIEDDGSQDVETKSGVGGSSGAARDKDKCPDVLGVLLNIKKQALMQDPEVRAFLNKLMNVIKS